MKVNDLFPPPLLGDSPSMFDLISEVMGALSLLSRLMMGGGPSLSGRATTGAVIALVVLLWALTFGRMTLTVSAGVPRALADCHVGSEVTPLADFLGAMVAVN